MTSSQWFEHVSELGPFASEGDVWRAIRATLRALAEQLDPVERIQLGRDLPSDLRVLVESNALRLAEQSPTKEAFFQSVAAYEMEPVGRALEHAEIVCRALADTLSETTVARLTRQLPALAELFRPPERPAAAQTMGQASPRRPQDLAEGRPGGTHPIASSDTSTLAHRHSIARSDDPHADTKLSSAMGLSQERDSRTLAAGRPGSRHPVSDSH